MPDWEIVKNYYIKGWNGSYYSKSSNSISIILKDPCLQTSFVNDKELTNMIVGYLDSAHKTVSYTDTIS